MVGFIAHTTLVEDEEQEQKLDSKSRNLNYPLDPFDSDFPDLSFTDSFLDFDSIKEFFEVSSELDRDSSAFVDFGEFHKTMETADEQSCNETRSIVEGPEFMAKEEILDLIREGGLGDKQSFIEAPSVVADSELKVEEKSMELEREGNLGSSIAEEMGRVSLVGRSNDFVDAAIMKREIVGDEMEMTERSLVAASILDVIDGDNAKADAASNGTHYSNFNSARESGVNDLVFDKKDESASDTVGKKSSSSSTSSFDSSSDTDSSGDYNRSNDSGGSSSSSGGGGGDDDDEEEEEHSEEEEENKEVRVQSNAELEEGEIEEGEIRNVNGEKMVVKSDDEEDEVADKMVEWSDIEFDDVDEEEEEGAGVMREPVKSKNELKVLPSVPPVMVTLQPHHHMLPVGVVLSIIGAQVIVEGAEKHNPLNEGSILWITDERSPLGLVDEIFGPVQNPYYVVRYNSESEVPAGIHQGTLISFVSEFAHHVLNDKNLYKKGYDASGENDEELSDDAEFSDDEKEAEYKRMQKMSKRSMNQLGSEHRRNNRSKVKNRNGNWNNNKPSPQQRLVDMGQQQLNHYQHNVPRTIASTSNGSSFAIGKDFTSGTGFFQPFPPMLPANAVPQPSNGGWTNMLPSQQPHNAFIPGGFLANNMHQLQHLLQQQFNPSQSPLSNVVVPGGSINLCAGPTPWTVVAGQNCFNQSAFGVGFQMQPPLPIMNAMNAGEQGMMSNEPHMEQNCNLRPPAVASGNIQAPPQFNLGASSGRGGKTYGRRGGRGGGYAGGRGRHPSK